MKKLIAALIMLCFAGAMSAQIVKLEDVKQLKKSKVIIGLLQDDKLNTILQEAAKEWWTFSEMGEPLPKKEAMKKAKEDPNIYVLTIETATSTSLRHGSGASAYKTVSSGYYVGIFEGKGRAMIMSYIPAFGGSLTKEILVFGISSTQYLCETMVKENMSTNMKFKQGYKKYSNELKKQKLYVAEGWIGGKKINNDNLDLYYNYPIEAVTYEKWSDAILSRKEGVAYSIVVPFPVGGKYSYCHYIVDAATGKVFGMAYPKVAVNVGGINVSKSNTGYINEKNLQMYNDVAEGTW